MRGRAALKPRHTVVLLPRRTGRGTAPGCCAINSPCLSGAFARSTSCLGFPSMDVGYRPLARFHLFHRTTSIRLRAALFKDVAMTSSYRLRTDYTVAKVGSSSPRDTEFLLRIALRLGVSGVTILQVSLWSRFRNAEKFSPSRRALPRALDRLFQPPVLGARIYRIVVN